VSKKDPVYKNEFTVLKLGRNPETEIEANVEVDSLDAKLRVLAFKSGAIHRFS
jgi:hypothetical protein